MGGPVIQQGGRAKGPIRWGLNIFLLIITGGLWIFAFPWWPRHQSGYGANAAAVSSPVINIQAPAPTADAPIVHATITAEKDPAEELRKLKSLHDDGILTDQEYESRRSALVEQLGYGTKSSPESPPRQLPAAEPEPPTLDT
jgi:hypothetical protein